MLKNIKIIQKGINNVLKGKVPNQRVITVHKQKCDKNHTYTANNLEALDEAAGRLTQKASFKLYIYLAKNQDEYRFNLSSSDFMRWANVGNTAYNTAFRELVEEGYLIQKEGTKDIYTFYDKSQIKDEVLTIEIPKEKVKQIKEAKKKIEEAEKSKEAFYF